MYFLIGGGEIGDLETFALDATLVELAGKRNPAFLFIPTASHDSEGYVQAVRSVYEGRLRCGFDHLSLSEDLSRERIEDKVAKADIIYVGGGDTKYLMDAWRERGLDTVLARHKDRAILAGLSAGSICWFEKGISDTASFSSPDGAWQYCLVDGLGFLPGLHSPHLDEREKERAYIEFTAENDLTFIGIDNGCALAIDGPSYRVLRAEEGRDAYLVTTRQGRTTKRRLADGGAAEELFGRPPA